MKDESGGMMILGVIMFVFFLFVGAAGMYDIGYRAGFKHGSRFMIEESVDNTNVFNARQIHYSAEIVIEKELEKD